MTEEIKPEPPSEFHHGHPRLDTIILDSMEERVRFDILMESLTPEEKELFLKRQNELVRRIIEK